MEHSYEIFFDSKSKDCTETRDIKKKMKENVRRGKQARERERGGKPAGVCTMKVYMRCRFEKCSRVI